MTKHKLKSKCKIDSMPLKINFTSSKIITKQTLIWLYLNMKMLVAELH